MAEGKYNMKNPAVKRILQEVKEMQANPSDDFMSLPLEENIFEWQFAIKGPRDTEFEGGIYHGRIQLPADYPFQPPAFMLLSPNGRFETQTKICLSISSHHPEHWQPSWSANKLDPQTAGISFWLNTYASRLGVRVTTAGLKHATIWLLRYMSSLNSFTFYVIIWSVLSISLSVQICGHVTYEFETPLGIFVFQNSASDSCLMYDHAVRTALVALIAFMPTNPDGALGSLDYKKEQRRELAIKSREAAPKYGTPERQKIIDEIHEYMLSKVLPAPPQHSPQQPASEEDLSNKDGEAQSSPQNGDVIHEDHPIPEADDRIVEDAREVHVNANAGPLRVSFNAGVTVTRRVPATDSNTGTAVTVATPASDRLFTLAAIGLAVAIAYLLLKKFLKSSGHDIGSM
ncbi:hypothetical protein C5167_016117 [Papaver somniferum]|nr:hypothetical protein C5167_016117 [Papaver somniferum]